MGKTKLESNRNAQFDRGGVYARAARDLRGVGCLGNSILALIGVLVYGWLLRPSHDRDLFEGDVIVSDEITFRALDILGAFGALALVYLFFLWRAPFKQRDEARSELNDLDGTVPDLVLGFSCEDDTVLAPYPQGGNSVPAIRWELAIFNRSRFEARDIRVKIVSAVGEDGCEYSHMERTLILDRVRSSVTERIGSFLIEAGEHTRSHPDLPVMVHPPYERSQIQFYDQYTVFGPWLDLSVQLHAEGFRVPSHMTKRIDLRSWRDLDETVLEFEQPDPTQ